jgi:hypothetical protein
VSIRTSVMARLLSEAGLVDRTRDVTQYVNRVVKGLGIRRGKQPSRMPRSSSSITAPPPSTEGPRSVVLGALERLMEGRTTFTVAHRLSTIRGADVILAPDHGRLVQHGSHEDLLAEAGLQAVARPTAWACSSEKGTGPDAFFDARMLTAIAVAEKT